MIVPSYDEWLHMEAGTRLRADPPETPEYEAAAGRARYLVERGLDRIGALALAFLSIHQPERENGEPVWRLTAMGGHSCRGLIVPEAILEDPDALDAFLREHTPDAKKAS